MAGAPTKSVAVLWLSWQEELPAAAEHWKTGSSEMRNTAIARPIKKPEPEVRQKLDQSNTHRDAEVASCIDCAALRGGAALNVHILQPQRHKRMRQ
jgi:hypothetical protein